MKPLRGTAAILLIVSVAWAGWWIYRSNHPTYAPGIFFVFTGGEKWCVYNIANHRILSRVVEPSLKSTPDLIGSLSYSHPQIDKGDLLWEPSNPAVKLAISSSGNDVTYYLNAKPVLSITTGKDGWVIIGGNEGASNVIEQMRKMSNLKVETVPKAKKP